MAGQAYRGPSIGYHAVSHTIRVVLRNKSISKTSQNGQMWDKMNLLSKKRCSSACSNPAAAASCSGELVQNVTLVLAARQALIRSAGPISQPTLHPVAENCFPALPTVIVLFQKLSSEAIRTCFDGLRARTSYCRREGFRSALERCESLILEQ